MGKLVIKKIANDMSAKSIFTRVNRRHSFLMHVVFFILYVYNKIYKNKTVATAKKQ